MIDMLAKFIGTVLGRLTALALRAVIIMFLAAVIAENFGVWSAIGFPASMAWAGGYGLARGFIHKEEEEEDGTPRRAN